MLQCFIQFYYCKVLVSLSFMGSIQADCSNIRGLLAFLIKVTLVTTAMLFTMAWLKLTTVFGVAGT